MRVMEDLGFTVVYTPIEDDRPVRMEIYDRAGENLASLLGRKA